MTAGRKTFQQVADLAKVSLATVSRVANGSARVSPEIQQRVKEAALRLGVDLHRQGKANLIAFLLCNRDLLHPFHSRVLVGAEAYCAARNYSMLFLSFRDTKHPILKNNCAMREKVAACVEDRHKKRAPHLAASRRKPSEPGASRISFRTSG